MDPVLLLMFGGFVVFVAGVVAVDRVRAGRLRQWSATGTGPDDACAVCGSADIVHPMPDVYLCGKCGHEGGEGLPALQRERWKKQVAGLPAEERRARGLGDAEEGRRLLLAAEGPLSAARGALDAARRSMKAEQRAGFLEQAMAANHDATEEIFRAHKLLLDALWLLTEEDAPVALPEGAFGIDPEHDWAALNHLRGGLVAVARRVEIGEG